MALEVLSLLCTFKKSSNSIIISVRFIFFPRIAKRSIVDGKFLRVSKLRNKQSEICGVDFSNNKELQQNKKTSAMARNWLVKVMQCQQKGPLTILHVM